MAQGLPSERAPVLFPLSLLLPVSFALAAWQSVAAARRGQREAWVLAAFHGLLAVVLSTRWAWELGAATGDLAASLSLSYAGFQTAAFAPALWLPQLVHLPWIARPERAARGAARFAWWLGVAFAALALLFTLAGTPGMLLGIRSWHESEGEGARRAGDPLVRATRLPPLAGGPAAAPPWLDEALDELAPDATLLVVRADDLLRAGAVAASAHARVRAEREAGRRILVALVGPAAWYEGGVPADTAAGAAELARAAGAVARLRPEWLFPVADAALLTQLCARGESDSARARSAVRALQEVADSVRAAGSSAHLGLAGFEPWPGTQGADAMAGARRAVYVWAAAAGSPFDRVGFVLHAGFHDRPGFGERLRQAEEAMVLLSPGKRAWVLECAGSPGAAGERHQREHLRAVLSWAGARGSLEGVAQTAFADGPERAGLVSWLGRRRAAFADYRARAGPGP